MILPIENRIKWVLISQQKQTQIHKDNIRKNRYKVYHNYKVRYNIMLTNHTVYKNETEYKGPFFIKQCFTNVTINLQCGVVQIKYNMRQIQPYISDTESDEFKFGKYF